MFGSAVLIEAVSPDWDSDALRGSSSVVGSWMGGVAGLNILMITMPFISISCVMTCFR